MQPPKRVKNSSGIFHRPFLCILTLLWFNLQLNSESGDYEICYSSPWKLEWIKCEEGDQLQLQWRLLFLLQQRTDGGRYAGAICNPLGWGWREGGGLIQVMSILYLVMGSSLQTQRAKWTSINRAGVKRSSCASCLSIFLGICVLLEDFQTCPTVLKMVFWAIHKHAGG